MTLLLAVGFGLLIGLSLGALGGGGSILTVPVLVFAVGESARSATTGSLTIVGITAAVAAVSHARAGHLCWGTGLAFVAAGVPAVLAGTRLNSKVEPDVLLLCFAGLMLLAAGGMLAKTMVHTHPDEAEADGQASALRRPGRTGTPATSAGTATDLRTVARASGRLPVRTAAEVVVAGVCVGFLTGFLGVGGGFIIVPTLVLALRLEVPAAVGTSLLVISLNSAVALLARGGDESFHWAVITPFTLAAIAGSTLGRRIAEGVTSSSLTRAFAALLLAVACFVLVQVALG